jgi:hypothetical protein
MIPLGGEYIPCDDMGSGDWFCSICPGKDKKTKTCCWSATLKDGYAVVYNHPKMDINDYQTERLRALVRSQGR